MFFFLLLGLQLDESRRRDSCSACERGQDGNETERILFSGHLFGAADIWLLKLRGCSGTITVIIFILSNERMKMLRRRFILI